jgi:energy-coupling factor transport system permease protein
MSEYEFLRNVPFGQYVPVDSPVHRQDPRARLVSFFLLLMALTFTKHIEGLLLGGIILIGGIYFARLSIRFTLRSLIAPLPFILVLALVQLFFNNQPNAGLLILQIGQVQIYKSDLLAGALLIVRFATLVIGLTFATQCISTSEMTHGLEKLLSPLKYLKVPVRDIVMTIQIAIRYIPLLAQVAERIAKAQASRGAAWQGNSSGLWKRVRMVVPLLIPLFIISMRRAENMALAMDARGYGGKIQHSSMLEMKFRWVDGLVVFCSFVLSIIIMWL